MAAISNRRIRALLALLPLLAHAGGVHADARALARPGLESGCTIAAASIEEAPQPGREVSYLERALQAPEFSAKEGGADAPPPERSGRSSFSGKPEDRQAVGAARARAAALAVLEFRVSLFEARAGILPTHATPPPILG